MRAARLQTEYRKSQTAFSLVELLVVMAIIGILASIGLPALRGLGGSNDIAAANRQLMDDLSYARFKAINERTTVYMVFVSQDILTPIYNNQQKIEVAKRANLQFTSYAIFARRTLGDQPGVNNSRYLTEWRSLPEGVFILTNKFDRIAANLPDSARQPIELSKRPFGYADFPFPTANPTDKIIKLPTIAFDYQGRFILFDGEGKKRTPEDFVIPMVKGSIIYPQDSRDPNERKTLKPAEIIETPKGNYTNNPVIRIDWLTGRARSLKPENFYGPS
jgi:prepilin-type N-terminal cleavage/methylation domain-containing protein